MKYYHGSPIAGISVLNPYVSNHNKSFVYVSTNEVVSTFYMVKNNWYTYGFCKGSSAPIYTEYYKDALIDTYKNKVGYLYECENIKSLTNPTNINCAFVCEDSVPIKKCSVVDDIYEKLINHEKRGELKIERYEYLSPKQLDNIRNIVVNEIIDGNLLKKNNEYTDFIKARFPTEWYVACNNK